MDKNLINEYWDIFAAQEEKKITFPITKFQGYHQVEGEGKVLQLWDNNGKPVDSLKGIGFVLFDKTVFYAEGGGQPSDYGWLFLKNNQQTIEVIDLNKKILDHYYVHLVNTNKVIINLNDILNQKIDVERRKILTQNHSGQHLFCDALNILANKILPEHSIGIKLDYFTSEFYWDDFFTIESILKARDLTMSWIKKAIPSKEIYMDLETARSKNIITREYDYNDYVRVVEFENTCADLCGGTHIDNTNQLNCIEIIDISITKKYVTIKATTNKQAYLNFFQSKYEELKNLAEKSIEKINKFQKSSDLSFNKIDFPTTYEELQKLKIAVEDLNKLAQEAEKQYKKEMQVKVANYHFINPEEKLMQARWLTFEINDQNLPIELFRNRILTELKANKKTIIYCCNSFQNNSAVIAAGYDLQPLINLKTEFEKFNWTTLIKGGGSPTILELIADPAEIKLFLKIIKEKLNNK